MTAYYNEFDPAAAAVLRELMSIGIIAPGHIDTRSIKEVQPDDLEGFIQCHFFAGAGIWSAAARLAGWPDDAPLWTGSCPCQGESVAGKRLGADDPRHLWPDLFRLVRARRPPVLVGEQVAAAAGTHWLDGVITNLESEGYATRAVDIPACAVDAPHIRQRLYWSAVADAGSLGCAETFGNSGDCLATHRQGAADRAECFREPDVTYIGNMGDATGYGWTKGFSATAPTRHRDFIATAYGRNGSFWSGSDWLHCHDGKARRTKPGLRLLVDGMAGRTDSWRVAGNAIVLPLAAEVLAALKDALVEEGTR